MSGVIFYDEINGPVVLKTSIQPYGVIGLECLDAYAVDRINEVLDLDLSPVEFAKHVEDEYLMRRVSSLFWYSSPQERRPKRAIYRTMVEYADFLRESSGGTPGVPGGGVASVGTLTLGSGGTVPGTLGGTVPGTGITPVWFPGDRGFWIYPPSYITRARSSLKSLIALWLNLEGITTTSMDHVPVSNALSGVQVFHDKKNKVVYTLFKLNGNSDSVCLEVDTSNVFARTFKLKHEENLYYTVAIRYANPTSLVVRLLRYPEWDVEKAYSALFDGIIAKPDSLVTVKLKIE